MNDRQQGQPQGQDQNPSKERHRPSAIEWVVGAISTVLVLGGIGFLVFEAWRGTSLPPLVSVRVETILPQPTGGYVVGIVAENRGGTTARNLVVEGKLIETEQASAGGQTSGAANGQVSGTSPQGGREVEKATTTLSWVPAHAERKGGLFFSHDPRQYRLEIKPQGYDRP